MTKLVFVMCVARLYDNVNGTYLKNQAMPMGIHRQREVVRHAVNVQHQAVGESAYCSLPLNRPI